MPGEACVGAACGPAKFPKNVPHIRRTFSLLQTHSMARMSIPAVGSDPTSINLTQILARLHQQLIVPDEATEARLSSSMERHRLENVYMTPPHSEQFNKGLTSFQSLAHANSLLLELEQDALSISNPNKKQETQAELFKKRELILRLEERLGEYNEVCLRGCIKGV